LAGELVGRPEARHDFLAGDAPPQLSARGNGASTAQLRARSEAAASATPRSCGTASEASSTSQLCSRQRAWSLRHRQCREKQEQALRDKEAKELQECTFRPTISGRSKLYANRARGCSVEPFVERLHHEADKRTVLRERAKELMETDARLSHTFKPIVNARSMSSRGGSSQKPLHLRADSLHKQRQDRLRIRQEAEGRRQECPFQPKISETSRRIIEAKRQGLQRSFSEGAIGLNTLGPVEARLYADAQLMEQKRLLRQQSAGELAQVSVDEGSKRICESSVYFQGAQQDFLTRQQTFEAARQRRREIRARHAEDKCSFQPSIASKSRQLVAGNLDFLQSTPRATTERLAVKDLGRRCQRREQLLEAQGQDYTFKPTVNAVSEQLVASGATSSRQGLGRRPEPAHERLYQAAVAFKESGSIHESEAQECTFKPQVSPGTLKMYPHIRSRYVGDGGEVAANMQKELGRRDEQLAEKRRELEERQMAECTFAPEMPLRRAPPRHQEQPVTVSGLGRFFELRGMTSRQQEDQRQREERVFHRSIEHARCGGVTIPAPFDFSKDRPSRGSEASIQAEDSWR